MRVYRFENVRVKWSWSYRLEPKLTGRHHAHDPARAFADSTDTTRTRMREYGVINSMGLKEVSF
jgi:hypothetical protein